MAKDKITDLSLAFDQDGLVGCIVVDAASNQVLMFAHMNAEALVATQRTGRIHFFSRSRQKLWMKGETSGETFHVVEMRVDCDQDCLLARVEAEGKGNACHTGRRSCFYRVVDGDKLVFKD
jgi:phosphoribosyl-AMP cyclohydrolase